MIHSQGTAVAQAHVYSPTSVAVLALGTYVLHTTHCLRAYYTYLCTRGRFCSEKWTNPVLSGSDFTLPPPCQTGIGRVSRLPVYDHYFFF